MFSDEPDPRVLTRTDVAEFRRLASHYFAEVLVRVPNSELRNMRYQQVHDALLRAERTAQWLYAERLALLEASKR